MIGPKRSVLVFSAVSEDAWTMALDAPSDAVILDLEDGTMPSLKNTARAVIIEKLAGLRRHAGQPQIWVRVNSPRTPHGLRDLLALIESDVSPDALVLPKVSHPEEVRWVAALMTEHHARLELVALIENQAGLEHASAIAQASPRLSALFLGSVDLSGELGSDMSWEALYGARSTLVRAASQAGIDVIDGPWLDVADEVGLHIELERVVAMGFTGKASYAPSQVAPIHAALTPTPEAIDRATRIIAAVETSPTGAAVVDGRSVNRANAKGAERLLIRARRFTGPA